MLYILSRYYEDTELFLLQTASEVAVWISSVHCGFMAFTVGWRLHCAIKYMPSKDCIFYPSAYFTYPMCASSKVNPSRYDDFPHCTMCPVTTPSLGLSDVYEK